MTWNSRAVPAYSATDLAGNGAWIDWVSAGVPVGVDVTGTVSASGLVTFVITGLSDSAGSIGSRESLSPPTLTVETVIYPAS